MENEGNPVRVGRNSARMLWWVIGIPIILILLYGLCGPYLLRYIATAYCMDSSACHQPLSTIEDQQISKITVEAHVPGRQKRTIELTDPTAIKFVADHLANLESRMYDHSSPNFELTFQTAQGGYRWLRVSEIEIGPGASASEINRHWFPKDSKLYAFLIELCYGKAVS